MTACNDCALKLWRMPGFEKRGTAAQSNAAALPTSHVSMAAAEPATCCARRPRAGARRPPWAPDQSHGHLGPALTAAPTLTPNSDLSLASDSLSLAPDSLSPTACA